MKDLQIFFRQRYGNEEVVFHRNVMPTQKAELAIALAERWGLVAAEFDGEDSAGRSRSRRMTPSEITAHACDTAAALWAEFEKRDWLVEVPLPRTGKELKAPEEEVTPM